MAYVTVDDVSAILDDTELDDDVITTYITSGHTLITSALSNAGLSEDLLTEIERWFVAHMIASSRERTAQKEGAGGASITYTGEYGQGLESTQYGQMVKLLDTSGILASLGGKLTKIYAIPTPQTVRRFKR